MSSTFSSCSRESSRKGSVAVTRRSTSSTSHSSSAAIETRCWASTSSGFCGITVSSISPSRMRLATTAHSSRSARNLGKIRPFETSPERVAGAADPLQAAGDRLRRLDLDHQVDGAHVDAELQRGGRDQAGQLPGLEQLLDHRALLVGERAVVGAGDLRRALVRLAGVRGVASSRARRARSPAAPPRLRSLASSFRRLARRSAARRLLTKMIVEVCSRTSSQELRVDRRPDRADVARVEEPRSARVDALG